MARWLLPWLIYSTSMGVAAPVHQSAEERELAQQVELLESRYRTFQAKYQDLKRKTDALESRGASLPSIVQGRLTPTSSLPVTVVPTTNNATIYFTPYKGNYVSIYFKGNWRLYRFAEISLALAGTTANNTYDVFIYRGNLGTVALELSAAWSGLFTRTDALTLLNGVYVKNSDNSRRYLGTVRINGTNNRYDDSEQVRGLWNYYNRVPRHLRQFEASNTWNYGVNAWRQAQGDATNDLSFVLGIAEVLTHVRVKTNNVSSNNTNKDFSVGIGMNTIQVNAAQLLGSDGVPANNVLIQAWAELSTYPAAGYNTTYWIENGISANNVTSYGDNGLPIPVRSGILCIIEG